MGQAEPWTTVFPEIHLEYGNEIWGSATPADPFMGATMNGGVRGGQVANDRLGMLKASPFYNESNFNLVIGGQTRFPGRQEELEANSSTHDTIGFAPYYAELNAWGTPEQRYYPLFATAKQNVTSGNMVENQQILANSGQGTDMAIYEVNVHATNAANTVPLTTRNEFLTGMGSGLSLPLVMLTYMRDMGITDQAAFQSLQYSTQMSNGDYAKVWGLLRDLEATGRKRPTWLGLEMANKAIQGTMVGTSQSGANPTYIQQPSNGITAPIEVPYVQSFVFANGTHYGMVLFNLRIEESGFEPVQINLPMPVKPEATLYKLTGDSVNAGNEAAQNIAIETIPLNNFQSSTNLTLSPHSMWVLTWETDYSNAIYLPILRRN
jgi:hypothetical protein